MGAKGTRMGFVLITKKLGIVCVLCGDGEVKTNIKYDKDARKKKVL